MRARPPSTVVSLLVAACALAACPGRLENPEAFVGTSRDGAVQTCTLGVSNVEMQLIHPRCATSNCHDRAGHAGGLDLDTPGISTRLLGVRSSACAGQILVDPNMPGGGYLIEKLAGTPRCGARMPSGAPPLTASELSCVRSWVATLHVDAGTPVVDVPRDVPVDRPTDMPVDRPTDIARDIVSDAPDAPPMDVPDDTANAPDDTADAPDVPQMDGSVDAPDAADAGSTDDASDATDSSRDAPTEVAIDAGADT